MRTQIAAPSWWVSAVRLESPLAGGFLHTDPRRHHTLNSAPRCCEATQNATRGGHEQEKKKGAETVSPKAFQGNAPARLGRSQCSNHLSSRKGCGQQERKPRRSGNRRSPPIRNQGPFDGISGSQSATTTSTTFRTDYHFRLRQNATDCDGLHRSQTSLELS